MLGDVRPLGVTGRDAEEALGAVHITANKNGIPFDPETPVRTSGIRLGTPTVTTRGFGIQEMNELGELIYAAISLRNDPGAVRDIAGQATALASRFPLPGVHLTPHLGEPSQAAS
jgi:glycine hydroxymethyltransferase